MTRQEIIAAYSIQFHGEHGVIVSPGKFEGEPLHAPYFYDAMLNGDGEEQEDGSLRFAVTAEDVAEFPELDGVAFVDLTESESGFVYLDHFVK